MNNDLFLVLGLLIGGLSVPALFGALSDGRTPRTGAIMIMIATGLVVLAISNKPGGYSWNDIPQAFVRVVARVVN